MVRKWRGQPGEGRASRELCTFYTFVLCTALLILHPIMLLLEPICKELLQKFICVYVNNTAQKQEGKISAVRYRFFSFLFIFGFAFFFFVIPFILIPFLYPFFKVLLSFGLMGALILQQRSEGYNSILSISYMALPSKLGVSLQRK